MYIPSQIMDFRLYNADERLIGTGEEVKMPTITNIAASLDLPGGKIDIPSMRTENMEMDVPFMVFDKEAGGTMSLTKTNTLIIRASKQKVNSSSHNFIHGGIKVTTKGYFKECELGTLKRSDKMDSNIKQTIAYIKIEVAETPTSGYETVLEIDKLNGVYKINGEDMREGIDQFL
ncbi:MAG: phage major tail tube protein [bacterium]|nr:phage major tail tube protein [bacterium]